MFPKRSGNTNDDCLTAGKVLLVPCEGEELFSSDCIDPRGRDRSQWGESRLKFTHTLLIEIETQCAASGLGKANCKWNADIAEANDCDLIKGI